MNIIKWLFKPFNELEDRPIDIIAIILFIPLLYVLFCALLVAYPELT